MLNSFYYISKNTFKECLREPIFFILLIAAIFLIGLFPSLSLFVFREQVKLVVDSAMATTMVFGLIAAVLCASHTVSREMNNGTVLLLLSKPVNRKVFIAAKITGITAALTIFVFICNVSSLISVRVAVEQFQLDFKALYIYYFLILLCSSAGAARNFFYQASFSSTAIILMALALPIYAGILHFVSANGEPAPLKLDMIPALILLFYCVWTMGIITVTLSTRLDMIANLTVCCLIFFIGLISTYLFGKEAYAGNFLSKIIYALIPNWQFFWMADALAGNQPIPAAYIFWSGCYVLLFMCLCGLWAAVLFEEREAGKDTK